MNWAEFFSMGGYAFYVWSAWGLSALVMAYLFTQAKWQNAKLRRELKRQIQRDRMRASNVKNPHSSHP